LDWAEVDTNNYCTWVFVRKIHRPNTSASADVEDATWSIGNWCAEELAIQHQSKDVVPEIEAILLELVVWQEIGAFAEGVVATTILILVV
jgi:hypothetical protein